jgi:NIMA (never in mitosis gene a)-related kinase
MSKGSMKDFQVLTKIGDGAYSEVYKVRRISDMGVYALKKVKMGKLSSKEKENALNEVRILASIQHPNVVAYKEAFFEDSTSCLCLVMEFADDGDLYELITNSQKKGNLVDEYKIWSVLIETARGLDRLH